MLWVTRPTLHVDRASCAWLIRRFIDTEAKFAFIDDGDLPASAVPFDMVGVELSHHGDYCSFETMLRHFDLDDTVLWDLARLVHEADLDDDRFDVPEARGLDMICRGLATCISDEEILEVTGRIFDGLYEYRRRALLLGRDPG